jgi:hypothetical protein
MLQLSQESGAGASFDVRNRLPASDGTTQRPVLLFFRSPCEYTRDKELIENCRPSALTLVADPMMAFAMDFDNLVAVCKLFR